MEETSSGPLSLVGVRYIALRVICQGSLDREPRRGDTEAPNGVRGEQVMATQHFLEADWGISANSMSKCCRFLSPFLDRKSTRLNSSHVAISYAVFCLKKKYFTASGASSLITSLTVTGFVHIRLTHSSVY